jgi:hypothetical protein
LAPRRRGGGESHQAEGGRKGDRGAHGRSEGAPPKYYKSKLVC